jgi:hypothetical protein
MVQPSILRLYLEFAQLRALINNTAQNAGRGLVQLEFLSKPWRSPDSIGRGGGKMMPQYRTCCASDRARIEDSVRVMENMCLPLFLSLGASTFRSERDPTCLVASVGIRVPDDSQVHKEAGASRKRTITPPREVGMVVREKQSSSHSIPKPRASQE